MKPLIIGMGPSRAYPTVVWHPKARSTANLSRLIMGSATRWPAVERHFEVIDLNKRWHWVDGVGDSIQPSDAEETLRALIASRALRGGRKVFLLGEQVTSFMLASLRRSDSALARDAWHKSPKCTGLRLRTEDADARIGTAMGYYDFVAIPVWHPRILSDQAIRMPPGWQQQMMNVMRAASQLPPMKFNRPRSGLSGQQRDPTGLQFPSG